MTQLVGELAKRNVTQSQKSSDISGQFQAFRQQIAATSAAAAAVENHNENISIDLLTYDSTGSLSPPTLTAFPAALSLHLSPDCWLHCRASYRTQSRVEQTNSETFYKCFQLNCSDFGQATATATATEAAAAAVAAFVLHFGPLAAPLKPTPPAAAENVVMMANCK